MRDKKRIPKILNELERIWKENPDLRLGQIMIIATRPKNSCPEVFYIEDEKMLEGIQSIGQKTESSEKKRIPYWELYSQIIRIKIEDITPELIKQFIEAVRKENPNQILTPRSMMKLLGAPIEDLNWLSTQKERIEKLENLLKEFERKDEIEQAEIGYKIKK
ncbi:MAG: hypothetical protein AB8F94_02605 [Saprospiraceae bacterium]